MFKKRGSWLTRIAILLGLVGLLGFSIFPLLSGVIEAMQTPQQSPTASAQTASEANRSDLEAQARGYELVLQREPENETALMGLLQVRLQLNDIDGTIEPLEKLAQLNPTEDRYPILLAQTKQYLGDREGAAQTYRTLLTAKPGNVRALEGLVQLLLDEERPEAAIGLLEDTLKNAPQANQVEPNSIDVTSVRILLARVYGKQERYPEALSVLDQTIQGNEKDFRPLLAKAIVLEEQGRISEAKPLLDKAYELAPAQYKDPIQARIEQLDAPNSASTPSEGGELEESVSPEAEDTAE